MTADELRALLAEREYLKWMSGTVPVTVKSPLLVKNQKHQQQESEIGALEFKSVSAMFATIFNVLLSFGACFSFVLCRMIRRER